VGIIVVAAVALIWGFFLATGRVRGESGRAILVLDRGHGIDRGTPVTYLGVQFGSVERVSLERGRVIVELRYRRESAELRSGDSIRVSSFGLFGGKQLDLIPGPQTARVIAPGDTLFAVQPPEVPAAALIERYLGTGARQQAPTDSPPTPKRNP
jgi:ABC-type transporter Mla subunit MlaD